MSNSSVVHCDSSGNEVSFVDQIPKILTNHLEQQGFAGRLRITARTAEDSRLIVLADWEATAGDAGAGGAGSEGVAILGGLLEKTNQYIYDTRAIGITDLPRGYRLECNYASTGRSEEFDVKEVSGELRISATSSFNGRKREFLTAEPLPNFNQFPEKYIQSIKELGGIRGLCGPAKCPGETGPVVEGSGSPERELHFESPVPRVLEMIRYPTQIRVCAAGGFAAFFIGIGFGIALFFFSPPPGLWTLVAMSSPLIAAVGFGLIAVGGAAARDYEREFWKRHEGRGPVGA